MYLGNDYPTPDGTGVRDYIHVVDLAKGHVAALKKLSNDSGLNIYNLGTGRGYSVLEIIQNMEKVVGNQFHTRLLIDDQEISQPVMQIHLRHVKN